MASTYNGDPTDVMHRSTHQTIVTKGHIDTKLRWAIFNKNAFTKALGVEGFGSSAMSDFEKFGKAAGTGSVVTHHGGSYYSGSVFETSGSTAFKGRMSPRNPTLVEGGDEWAYAYHLHTGERFIPTLDVDDNEGEGRLINTMTQKMEELKRSFARDFNYVLLGNSSQPDAGSLGPDSMNTTLMKALAVTNATVGGISQAATASDGTYYWRPQRKAITSLGGGGELDRPLMLRRKLMKVMNDAFAFAETTNSYVLVASQGAWQYIDQLAYADAGRRGSRDVLGTKAAYDAAGVDHVVFNNNPIVWDTAVTVPTGATASTESITGIHLPSYEICFHTKGNPTLDGWEPPRVHDQYSAWACQFKARYTPVYTQMRPHFVAYNMPQNTD